MQLWQRFTATIGSLPAARVTWGLALAFCVWALLDALVLKVSSGLANTTYDAMVRARVVAAAPDPRLVIVDIDEATLARMAPEFGRWPWPRDTLATVLDYIEKQNPQAIAWDVLFSDADRLSPGGDKAFDEAARRSLRSHFAVVRLPKEYDAQSKVTRAVLPNLWLGSAPQAGAAAGAGAGSAAPSALALADSTATVALIAPVLPAVAAAKLGYNNGYPDRDGMLRRYRVVESLSDNTALQSLAVSVAHTVAASAAKVASPSAPAASGAHTAPAAQPAPHPSNASNLIANCVAFTWAIGLFDCKNTDTLIVWRAQANSYPRVPLADVFAAAEGGAPLQPVPSFAGKIVLIGATASSLHDIHPTPLGTKHTGIDILATAMDNQVNQRSLLELPRWLQAGLAIGLCLGLAAWVQRHGIGTLDAALLLLPGALLAVGYVSLNVGGMFVDLHLAAGVALLYIGLLRVWNGWRRDYWCGDMHAAGNADADAEATAVGPADPAGSAAHTALAEHAALVQPHGLMAVRLLHPATGPGLDALIDTLQRHAPQCRVLGGDAGCTWPARLRWPELYSTVALAGPLAQLASLRTVLLDGSRRGKRGAHIGLRVTSCSVPLPVSQTTSRADWAQGAREVCAQPTDHSTDHRVDYRPGQPSQTAAR